MSQFFQISSGFVGFVYCSGVPNIGPGFNHPLSALYRYVIFHFNSERRDKDRMWGVSSEIHDFLIKKVSNEHKKKIRAQLMMEFNLLNHNHS